MGWVFYAKSKGDLVANLRKLANGYTLLADRCVGNHHWQVIQDPDGRKFIGVNLLSCQGGTWGYKGLEESMGPSALDCPLTFLGMCSEPTGYAAEWREKVRASHAERERKRNLTQGAKLRFGGAMYTLMLPLGRKGWSVEREDGRQFRMSCNQVNASEVMA